jgi:hypothetical protein
MAARSRRWAVIVALAVLGAAAMRVHAQAGGSAILGPPAPIVAAGATVPPPPDPPPSAPLPAVPTSPFLPPDSTPVGAPNEEPFPALSLRNDLFFRFELEIVKPVIINHISGPAMFPDGTMTTVAVPQASLQWTASPLFEIGKFLPDSCGFVALNYRFLAVTGTSTATTPDGSVGDLRSRLDFNIADLDYGTLPESFASNWFWSGRVGARLAQTYFDSQLTDGLTTTQATNWFLGGGFHGRIDVEHRFEFLRGLSIFGRADGAVVIGQVRQRFLESETAADGTLFSATGMMHHTETLPVIALQAGLGYTPRIWQNLHIEAGYAYEEWFRIAHIDSTTSSGSLRTNGAFVRLQLDY